MIAIVFEIVLDDKSKRECNELHDTQHERNITTHDTETESRRTMVHAQGRKGHHTIIECERIMVTC